MKTETYMGKSRERACDFCGRTAFWDGKTRAGPWAYMCYNCFGLSGVGLGTGLGQKLIYEDKPRLTPEVAR